MNPRLILAFSVLVAAFLVLAGLAYGGDSPRVQPAPADDVQDFVFFAQERPLLIRTHVRVDGKSYRAIWDDYVTKVFKFLDKDGDGVLSSAELDSMPPMQFLTGNGVFSGRMVKSPAGADRPTANEQGNVTRAELGAFLPVRVAQAQYSPIKDVSGHGKHTVRLVVRGETYPGSAGAEVGIDDCIVFR